MKNMHFRTLNLYKEENSSYNGEPSFVLILSLVNMEGSFALLELSTV